MFDLSIVQIQGGLGNQMFQYAFMRALSLKYNFKAMLDISYFYIDKFSNPDVAVRKFLLDNYNIQLGIADINVIRQYGFHIPILNRVFETPNCAGKYLDFLQKERSGSKYFIGYFQSEKYFKECRDVILKDFELKTPLDAKNVQLLSQIKDTNSVSIHIRRGDYLKLQHIYQICSLEYYYEAINFISKRIENPHFYIFSDDIDWAKNNLKINHPHTFVDINSEKNCCFDLELMKNCKHNIIANSTFSWWGAWLNENTDRIVISPKQWCCTDEIHMDDIICDDWIRI
ncbi:MAG: alpha-1,2-fucosyltransferase [Candidatus Gastranaerophilaceae bacterium]